MAREQVESFLRARGKRTQAARQQIVDSIRRNVGSVRGQERIDALNTVLDEIATDPRLSRTREAIRRLSALEAETARPQRDRATPGPPDKRLGLGTAFGGNFATVNVTGLGRTLAQLEPPGLRTDDSLSRFARNAGKDVGILASAPFVGGYNAAKANAQDVAAILQGANIPRQVVSGETAGLLKAMGEGIVEDWSHPGKYLQEHPLLFGLDVSGAASAAGRGAGAAMRGAGKKGAPGIRGKLDERSHVVRPPLALNDDAGQPILVQRTYSKDQMRREIQSTRDRGREPLLDSDGKPVTVEDRGRTVPVLLATEGERERYFKQRGDMLGSRTNLGERKVREEEGKEHKVRGVRGRAVRDIVQMVTEGTLLTSERFGANLRAHRAKVAAAIARHEDGSEPYRHSAELESARTRLALIDKVLGSPKAMAQIERIAAEGQRHGRMLFEGDEAAVEAKIIDPEAAKRARLSVTALEHMGGRHFTVEEHGKLEAAARAAENDAAAKVEAAKTPQARQAALAELSTAREHRIAVSGRHPEQTRAHENAQVALRTAEKALERAVETERKVGEKIRQLAATTRSERGREGHNQQIAAYYVGDKRFDLRSEAVEYAKSRGGGAASSAGRHIDYDSGFGVKKIMEHTVDLRTVGSVSIPPGRKYGTKGTHRMSDAQVAALDRRLQSNGFQRIDNADGSTTWRRQAQPSKGAAGKVEIRRVATTAGEARRVGQLSNARRALTTAKERRRAAQKAVKAATAAAKANPLPEARAAIRYGEDNPFGKRAGEYLSNEDIEAFLRSQGRDPETVGYLPHRHDITGPRAHHTQFRPGTRPVLDAGETRTGSAYLKGVTESSAALLRDQGVRQATQLNKARALDRLVEEHGLRHPAWAKAEKGDELTPGEKRIVDKGGLYTEAEALELAQRIENDTGQRFTPMRAYQGRLPDDVKDVIREEYQGPGGMTTISQRLLNDRIVRPSAKPDKRSRNIVLVPSDLIERLEAHLRPAGPVEKTFQYLNKPFRFAVLPQPRWLTGNFGEAYIVRLPMVGSGINIPGLAMDIRAQRAAIRAMRESGDPKLIRAADEIEAQQLGSGLFVGGKAGTVHRTAEEAMPEVIRRRYGRMVSKLPAVNTMAELSRSAIHWLAMPLHAFFWMNLKGIEAPAQKAAFGHTFRRDMQAITGSWLKSVVSSRQAVDDAMRGLVNTPAQQRFMNDQYELLGKYAGFNPTMRAFVQSVAPFLPWAMNAARFVFWTMPAHHTVKTALLVRAAEVYEKDWEEIHRNVPPGGLKDAIPTDDGGWVDLARYTPWGLTAPIAGGGDFRSLTAQFTPQFGGAVNALQGKDPFGRPLKLQPTPENPKGKPTNAQMAWIAGYDLLEALVPYMSTGRRLQEKGETSYSDSTIWSPKSKAGTSHGMSAIRRTFDPFRPTYLSAGGSGKPKPVDRFQKARERALEEDLWDNLDQNLGDAREQQRAADQLWEDALGG